MANWKGTAVPNSGTVEKVYFNTNLTVEEVYNLVNSIDHDFSTIPEYLILAGENFDDWLLISTTTDISESFTIEGAIGRKNVIIFSYNSLEESEGGNGWQTFNNPLTVNTTAISEDEDGIPIGVENDKLSSLFSITPFEEEVTLEGLLTDTCEAIREKEGTIDKILALDIPSRIRALSSGGIEGIIEVEELPLPSGWQGTAIPNSGTVENVYFNTNLSVEEVVNILQTLALNSEGVYHILYNQPDTGLPNLMAVMHVSPEDIWVISGTNLNPLYFISKPMSGIAENAGWQTFDNPVSFNLGASSSTGEFDVGNQNDKLSKIISSSPIEPIVNDIDTSKIYYLNRRVSDVYAFMGDSWVSMKNMAESGGGKFDVIVVKDKPTENIKVSDSDSGTMYGYFVENENDIFLYADWTGEGNPSWLSLSEGFFVGDATYGGHITDVSEATDPTKYYTNAVQTFYKYSNGWIEYKYGGIVPSGRHTITSNGVYDISDYASVDVNVSTSQEDGLIEGTLTTYTNDRITNIRPYAFQYYGSLTSVDLPKVTSIGSNAFQYCGSLISVDFPLVTSIGSEAFSSCGALTSINLPKVTSIENFVFENCSALTSVDLPNATRIGNYAFQRCSALTSVSFPLVTSIGEKAFMYCSSLTSVDLPNATRIGSSAFESCYSLTKLIIRTTSQTCTLSSISAFSFCYHILGTTNATYNPEGLKDGYIYVPDELVESYKTALNWSEYASQIKPLSEYVEK